MKKRMLSIMLIFVLLFSLTGCNQRGKETGEYQMYYLNMEMTKLVPEEYDCDCSGESRDELIVELLNQLKSAPESKKLRQTIPMDIDVNGFEINSSCLYLNFNERYSELSPTEEILIRAGIVRTMLQVPGVSLVSFRVNNESLRNHDGTIIGAMNSDSFVENPGRQINSSVESTLTLYFSNMEGTGLVKETRVVHYSTNISMEKLIMEQLIEGPKKTGATATVPSGTKLISVSTVEGVCYVNLTENFKNQSTLVNEEVVLFSIVNSLIEVPSVTKVQLSVNGDTKGMVRYAYDLSKMYEQNTKLLEHD